MRAVKLDDIAALVGVSAKTVSRVVNRDPRVSPETRRRIEQAIAEAGYQPNLAARSLATARSRMIGLFAPPRSSHFFSELIRATMRACRLRGYNLVVEEHDFRRDAAVDSYAKGLRNLRCDGILLPSPICDDLPLLDQLDRDGVRYVRISPAIQPERALALVADHAAGGRAVAEHFLALGHRRFGLVVGLPQQASAPIRRDAFIAAVVAAGGSEGDIAIADLANLPALQSASGERSLIDLGRMAALRLLSAPQRPEAIFAYNDELAAGVVVQARELGIDVPGDLAVAGFDDSDAARLCWPPLTTVRQPIADIALAAVAALTAESAPTPEWRVFPVSLVIRQTSEIASDPRKPG